MKKYVMHIIFFLFIFIPISIFGIFVGPTSVPVERLIANTSYYVKNEPNNHQAIYTLARIHYFAFTDKNGYVGVSKESGLPKVAPDWLLGNYIDTQRRFQAEKLALKELGIDSLNGQSEEINQKYSELHKKILKELEDKNWEPESKISKEEILQHAKEAMINFKKAIALDPDNALYQIGLASFCYQYLSYKKINEIKDEPTELKQITIVGTRDIFFNAYSLSINNEIKFKTMPIEGVRSLISYEAGNAYINISKSMTQLTESDKKNIEIVTKNITKLSALPREVITPIIFSINKESDFSNLLNLGKTVNFELNGDGKSEQWPWVKSTTGFLVWDPQNTGKITSGRQMFGSVTWWIFFENGYQALDALDDNRNGQLAGDELIGIRVWFDKNSNGISEPGEVVDLNTLGIKSIGTKPTGETEGMPMHELGITLTNGTKIPTYDWIAKSIK